MATESELFFLRQLRRESSAAAGWSAFLERYSGLMLQVARRSAIDNDEAHDRYLYACERLAENGFKRLLKFHRGGEAEFSAWLRAVMRNLCVDEFRFCR